MAQIGDTSATSGGSFMWGGRSWGPGDLAAFKAYLAAHGGNYATWSANHPSAAAIFGGLRTAVPATHPTNPAAPAAGAAPAGGAAPAAAPAATPAPVDLLSLIKADPLYQQQAGQLSAQDIADAASRKAAIQQALIQYGLVPDLTGLQGLSPDDLKMLQGDIDPATGQLASKNTAEGLSLSARIAQAHKDNLAQLTNALAARGMLSSGTTGFETGREDLHNKQATADALTQLLGQIGSYINSYKQGALGRSGTLSSAATDAANRVKDLLGDTNPGAASATTVAPANPVPAAAPAPAPIVYAPGPTALPIPTVQQSPAGAYIPVVGGKKYE